MRTGADGAANNWKYLSLQTNGSTNWDIATKNDNDDLSGALQFRIGGGPTNRTYMDTSGNWVMQGSVEGQLARVPGYQLSSYNAFSTTLTWVKTTLVKAIVVLPSSATATEP